MPDSPYILIVDDSPTQLTQLRIVLEEEGHVVRTAENGKAAIEAIQSDQPLLVVTDLQMPEMNGLDLVGEIKQRAPSVPGILTTSQGSEEIAADALHKGAPSYVPKRDMASILAPTVRQVISIVQAERSQAAISQYAVSNQIELDIGSDDKLIPAIVSRLEKNLIELSLFDEGERMQIAMALDEALTNAIIHGNLEVSSELRQLEDGQQYIDKINERKSTLPYQDRRVKVCMTANRDEVTFVITDEGPGFDPSSLPDPTDPENLEKAGGRGLLLINSFMCEVKHNKTGNEITMTKRANSDR